METNGYYWTNTGTSEDRQQGEQSNLRLHYLLVLLRRYKLQGPIFQGSQFKIIIIIIILISNCNYNHKPLCAPVVRCLSIVKPWTGPNCSKYGCRSFSSKCFGTCPTNNLTGSEGSHSPGWEGGGGGGGGGGSTVTETIGAGGKSGGLSIVTHTRHKVRHKWQHRDTQRRETKVLCGPTHTYILAGSDCEVGHDRGLFCMMCRGLHTERKKTRRSNL